MAKATIRNLTTIHSQACMTTGRLQPREGEGVKHLAKKAMAQRHRRHTCKAGAVPKKWSDQFIAEPAPEAVAAAEATAARAREAAG